MANEYEHQSSPVLGGDAFDPSPPRIAVLLPCHNEDRSIAEVVRSFRATLPEAEIVVCDNASTDGTAAAAREGGAVVLREKRRGKGHAIRRLFADVDADVYVLADGDGEHDAASARPMVRLLLSDRLDMVVGARQAAPDDRTAYRRGHATGNALLTRLFHLCVGGTFTDVLSGYRVMSRRFVKSFPVRSSGFDIEADLTAHALEVDANALEVATPYHKRTDGSKSKVRTYRDGIRILLTLIRLAETMYPAYLFSIVAAIVMLTGAVLGMPIIVHQKLAHPQLSVRYLAAEFLVAVSLVSMACGVILNRVKRSRRELRRLIYLQCPSPGISTVY